MTGHIVIPIVDDALEELYILNNSPEEMDKMTDFDLIAALLRVESTMHLMIMLLNDRRREYEREGCF